MIDLQGTRVLITGATGFIGSHLARRLAGAGAQVVAFRRFSVESRLRLERLRDAQVDWRDVDLRTFGAVSSAVKAARPDLVIHLAAEGVTDPFLPPDAAIRANVSGTIHLLRAVEGKAPVVVARTPGERDAMNVYAASKAAAWSFCRMYRRTHGWSIAGAMPFQTYGPGQALAALAPSAIAAALRGEDFPMTDGEQQRDWIFVEDVVDALICIGSGLLATGTKMPEDAIEIGTGRTTSVRKVVESIYRLAGGAGRPRVGVLPARPGEVDWLVADAERTYELIGWRARFTLEEGLRETIQWTREWLVRRAE
jgi:nucleoside-diphosphate-sugar epimerase